MKKILKTTLLTLICALSFQTISSTAANMHSEQIEVVYGGIYKIIIDSSYDN